jgi:DNA sulfur modification protein DndB
MPDWKHLVRERLASLRLTATAESDLTDELAQHLEDRFRELRSGGASEEEAGRKAISELDCMDPLRTGLERNQRMPKYDAVPAGDVRPGSFMEDLWRDLRYAVRTMRKSSMFVLFVVLTLALGIGANTTVFTVINTLILNPLPVRDSAGLAAVGAAKMDSVSKPGAPLRFNPQHSLDFRKYIQQTDSSTIPLTFNLRPRSDASWELEERKGGRAILRIRSDAGKILAQVDCQHRLGYLNDLAITLPFMTFLGLSKKEEMEVFNVINSKAKGLSTSLLDFHDASLTSDLAVERPELFIALHLNHNPESPWYRQLDLGGGGTSGLMRRASLRTMQKAVKRFLRHSKILSSRSPEIAAHVVLDFWVAISVLLREAWDNPRQHLINKGVGVYALMTIATDLYQESETTGQPCDKKFLLARLAEFITDLDWSSTGQLAGLGGEAGVKSALNIIRTVRNKRKLKVVPRG